MKAHNCPGCSEYKAMSRRRFFGVSAGAAAAVGAPLWLPRVAYAQEAGNRDVLIAIFLRGGCDGLSICVPHAEDAYYAARPTLNIPRPDSLDPNRAIDLDGFFGIPQSMGALLPAYNAGDLLIVHACGQTDETRSHFEAMNYMEVGKPRDPSIFTGWIARHLLSTAPLNPNSILRAIAINSALQRSLAGAPLALPIPDPDEFGLAGWDGTAAERLEALEKSYRKGELVLRATVENTMRTIGVLESIDFENYAPGGGAVYPDTYFGYAMRSAAALIKADLGVEAVATDLGGWDTHDGQQPRQGFMANLMQELAESLAAFHADLDAAGTVNYSLIVYSEFGRTFRENANGGTDHGHGNAMLVLGNHIAGGRVLADWPGLGPEDLFQGQDLDVTIDYRDILAEIVQYRLGNANLQTIFPDYTPAFRGVTE